MKNPNGQKIPLNAKRIAWRNKTNEKEFNRSADRKNVKLQIPHKSVRQPIMGSIQVGFYRPWPLYPTNNIKGKVQMATNIQPNGNNGLLAYSLSLGLFIPITHHIRVMFRDDTS
jgi:hypothetical protein